jgi:microcystin-dependent protein
MASTFSPSLRIELIGNGDQSGVWGQTTNSNLGTIIEQAITGVESITMVNTDYFLSNFNGVADEARNAVLVVGGANSAIRKVVAPLTNKTYTVRNNTVGGFAINIGGNTGAAVLVPNGATVQVYCDGTDFFEGLSGVSSNFTVPNNVTVGGVVNGSTAVFSGAISSVSPAFTGTPTAPTASPGTNTTQIATTAFVLANGVPTGGLVMWPTGSAPSGFLLCTGAAVSRTTFAALFAIVGTTFGVGDGSTTFNLPNYTNRMPYGTTVGATGGSADAVVVSHNHSASSAVSDPGHAHTFALFAPNGGGGNPGGDLNTSSPTTYGTNSAVTSISVSTTVNSAGVSGTNANLPPYLGINFIIKT